MHIITTKLQTFSPNLPQIAIQADRLTLVKRRWRCVADDGVEFGFDLNTPLNDGDIFYQSATAVYFIQQRPESVLEVKLIAKPAPVARLGWTIGNLHFPIQVTDDVIRTPDDLALRQLFARESIPFMVCERIFVPFGKTHSHGPE